MTLNLHNIVVKQNAENTGPQEGELNTHFEVVEHPVHNSDDGTITVRLKPLNP